jgi:hypothetical protein
MENKDQKVTITKQNGKTYAQVGEGTLKLEEGQIKNWGPFFDWLTEHWEFYDVKRQAEKNPYRQYVLNMQKDIIKESRKEYETFLEKISGRRFNNMQDVARPYREYLERRIQDVTREAQQPNLPDYFYPAFRGQIEVLKKILTQFTGYILAP